MFLRLLVLFSLLHLAFISTAIALPLPATWRFSERGSDIVCDLPLRRTHGEGCKDSNKLSKSYAWNQDALQNSRIVGEGTEAVGHCGKTKMGPSSRLALLI